MMDRDEWFAPEDDDRQQLLLEEEQAQIEFEQEYNAWLDTLEHDLGDRP